MSTMKDVVKFIAENHTNFKYDEKGYVTNLQYLNRNGEWEDNFSGSIFYHNVTLRLKPKLKWTDDDMIAFAKFFERYGRGLTDFECLLGDFEGFKYTKQLSNI